MSLKRLAFTAFIAGSVLKGTLIVGWRLTRFPPLGLLLTKYDPVAFYVAERITPLFFDQKRLFPGAGEGLLFEIVLTIVFGIECLLVGLAVRWILRRSHGSSQSSHVSVQ